MDWTYARSPEWIDEAVFLARHIFAEEDEVEVIWPRLKTSQIVAVALVLVGRSTGAIYCPVCAYVYTVHLYSTLGWMNQ